MLFHRQGPSRSSRFRVLALDGATLTAGARLVPSALPSTSGTRKTSPSSFPKRTSFWFYVNLFMPSEGVTNLESEVDSHVTSHRVCDIKYGTIKVLILHSIETFPTE